MTDQNIILGEDDPAIIHQVEPKLLRALAEASPQGRNESIALSARNQLSEIVGAVTCSTSYGWVLIKVLWVAESHRGAGLGRQLMQKAEDKARSIGCHHAWLDTSNPAAKRFYDRAGYAVFGTLENGPDNEPAGHCRWFMKKSL